MNSDPRIKAGQDEYGGTTETDSDTSGERFPFPTQQTPPHTVDIIHTQTHTHTHTHTHVYRPYTCYDTVCKYWCVLWCTCARMCVCVCVSWCCLTLPAAVLFPSVWRLPRSRFIICFCRPTQISSHVFPSYFLFMAWSQVTRDAVG